MYLDDEGPHAHWVQVLGVGSEIYAEAMGTAVGIENNMKGRSQVDMLITCPIPAMRRKTTTPNRIGSSGLHADNLYQSVVPFLMRIVRPCGQ